MTTAAEFSARLSAITAARNAGTITHRQGIARREKVWKEIRQTELAAEVGQLQEALAIASLTATGDPRDAEARRIVEADAIALDWSDARPARLGDR